MKIRKLGLNWGPAYEEAEPVSIEHGDIKVLAFIPENGGMQIQLPAEAIVEWGPTGLRISIPQA